MTPPGFIRLHDEEGVFLLRVSLIRSVDNPPPNSKAGAWLDIDGRDDWLQVNETVEQVASLMCSAAKPGSGS